MPKTEEDYVMSPDKNATVVMKTGHAVSIGSTLKMRLEHVVVEYFEDTIRINSLHEVPTEHVDTIIRDAGTRGSKSRSSRSKLDPEKNRGLEDYL